MQAIFIPHTLCHGGLHSISAGRDPRAEESTSAMQFERLKCATPFTRGSDHSSRFAGGQRAARCLPSVFRSWSCASSQQAWAFHAGWIESLGFEARVGNRELGFEHFGALPVSKRLSSQCVVMKEQFQFKPVSPRLALPSEVARFVVTPPPNPSFKRTCLRHAA